MKKTWLKVGGLVAALALVIAGAYFVGRSTNETPVATEQPAAASHMLAEEEPNGLNASHESMTLKVLTDSFPAGTEQTFAFQILQTEEQFAEAKAKNEKAATGADGGSTHGGSSGGTGGHG